MSQNNEVGNILLDAAKTFEERNKVYGDNYLKVGEIFKTLFPDLEIHSADDYNRFHILMLIVVKLTRYVQNWKETGHQDSIHDAAVYCAMLESIDAKCKSKQEAK